MRFVLVGLSISAVLLLSCNNSKEHEPGQKTSVSSHSNSFNSSVESAMNTYYSLTEAFVNWDSAGIVAAAKQLDKKLQQLSLGELKKDSSVAVSAAEILFNALHNLPAIIDANDITTKRHSLNDLTQNIYDLLRTVRYDEKKLWLNECKMPYNDQGSGLWLSKTDTIRNPYLGLHHPRYGGGMIDCGENKSVIDFTSGENEKKPDEKKAPTDDPEAKSN